MAVPEQALRSKVKKPALAINDNCMLLFSELKCILHFIEEVTQLSESIVNFVVITLKTLCIVPGS